MFDVRDVFRIFLDGHQILTSSKRSFFSGRVTVKQIEKQKRPKGSRGMLPRQNFENLHAIMAILVLFEQFLGQVLLNFCP